MKEVKVVMYMGDVRCVGCLPTGVEIDDPEVVILDEGSEVLSNECIACGHIHENLKLVNMEPQPEEEQELLDEPQPEGEELMEEIMEDETEEPEVVLPEYEEHDHQIGEEENF